MTDIPVLIVGAGPVGLSAAVFLADHGVPAMVVERHAGTSVDPKMRVVSPRVMELYRAVGMEDAIRAVRSPIADHTVVAHAETVAGPERHRVPTGILDGYENLSPCAWGSIDQDQLEPVLLEHARRLGVEVRFNTTLVGLTENPDSVTALVRDSVGEREYQVSTDHLVAADGVYSTVRSIMGIPQHGPGVLRRLISVHFRADLREQMRERRVIALSVRNSEVQGALVPVDGDRRWRFSIRVADGESTADYPEERCVRLLEAAIGVPGLPLVIERVSDGLWDFRTEVAERMRVGRVFVAGDAAHVMPPGGAFGAATGIQDACNLAWKLAMVHRGVAGESLLDTYESERLPVALETSREATERYQAAQGMGQCKPTTASLYRVFFGYVYREGAFLGEPGGDPEAWEDPENPSGRPGTRAPHVVVEHDGCQVSTLDLVGTGFALFAGPAATGWAEAADEVARRFDVRLPCYQVGHDLRDPSGDLLRHYGIGRKGAALIRPDGFVAWRTVDSPAPTDTLTDVLARVLHHPVGSTPSTPVTRSVPRPTGVPG
ncbi:FAD-dependent monooxygenase [Actinophytocola oryzae]|uniref:Putative polyketide hydroxylase n=1 Tax=Actinophytocola oryzae TaxID=502181 RepID=A0A4R7VVZ9_9PSEU|nr:FAD-dependent monooxygenase [Actinophytocola oryzae]TDV54216.1 putative polyketide hydroxylase [Actinophytocola oryzae]